jgi:hypothetical protein
LGLVEVVNVLARPLRYHAMPEGYMGLLRRFALDSKFMARWRPLVQIARGVVAGGAETPEPAKMEELWSPEKLRLAGAIDFIRGEFAAATEVLLEAGAWYERGSAPIGAASCFAELAICQFFADPLDPDPAIASAERAIGLAPVSRVGRELVGGVKGRMVGYFLARGDEQRGRALLVETGPPRVGSDTLERELGTRYRVLCDSLMGPAAEPGRPRMARPELRAALARWIGQAQTLNPADARGRWVAAELALDEGDDAAVAWQLRAALEDGFPAEDVGKFVAFALEKRPESEPLKSLMASVRRMPSEN